MNSAMHWHADWLASLPEPARLAFLASLSPEEADFLAYDWAFWARPDQRIPPGSWRTWLLLAGRGYGKTRVGSETVRQWARTHRFVNLIGATADDARDIMVEGESGILAVCPKDERPSYRKSERKLVWPNGASSLIFTADEPDRMRGKQHEKLWGDEVAAWRYADAWHQARLGLRLGSNPQALVTTTPRPIPIIKAMIKDPATHLTRGSTYDNRANLAEGFFADIVSRYEGTRLGRQELNAELLEDTPGALWSSAMIEAARVAKAPGLKRIVVAIDPPISAEEGSDECGIVVAGLGEDGLGYILADISVPQAKPAEWARVAIQAYHGWKADRIVAEVNQGGLMVRHTLETVDRNAAITTVHASKGKAARAEPVAALYEQGRVKLVGSFSALEDQMCGWVPGSSPKSPDRMDAMVWALTELMIAPRASTFGSFGRL